MPIGDALQPKLKPEAQPKPVASVHGIICFQKNVFITAHKSAQCMSLRCSHWACVISVLVDNIVSCVFDIILTQDINLGGGGDVNDPKKDGGGIWCPCLRLI